MRLASLLERRMEHLGEAGLEGRIGPGALVAGQFRLLPGSPGAGASATVDPRSLRFEAGDLLFCALRPERGRLWLADRAGTCTPEVLVLRPTGHPGRAFAALAHPDTLRAAARLAGGTRMPRVRGSDLADIALPHLPSDTVCDAILAILHRLSVLHRRDQAITRLLRLHAARALRHAPDGPALRDVVTLRTSLPRGVAHDGVVLHLGDLPAGGLIVHAEPREPLTGSAVPMQPGDVLLAALRPARHGLGLAPQAGTVSAEILVLDADPAWRASLVGWLLQPDTAAHLGQLSGGTRMPRLHRDRLLSLRVPDLRGGTGAWGALLDRATRAPRYATTLRDLLQTLILGA